MLSRSEEDHIKAVHALVQEGKAAGTKDVADRLGTKASSVTVMLKKLAAKGLLRHEPYYGATLTAKGRTFALKLVRNHRLWETFLVQRLGFGWDEVHDLAEQLEHVRSTELTDRLSAFLRHPEFDPHGDPIPDPQGRLPKRRSLPLGECPPGSRVRLVAVKDGSDTLLQLLGQKGLRIGMRMKVAARESFDASMEVVIGRSTRQVLSRQVAAQLLVEPAVPAKPK